MIEPRDRLKPLNLVNKLLNAGICCHDCGQKYGAYSVGCSSTWMAECPICEKVGRCTETRDYGYLQKGIDEVRATIKEQSKQVAEYMKSQEPILTEKELDEELTASYERGDITLKLTEEEVGFLNECLDTLQEFHSTLQPEEDGWRVPEDIALFESVEKKITDLYDNHCVHYSLSPALKKFHELYGTFGTENEQERAKWEVFRDAFHAGADHAKETK
jgi:hypothetical protein